MLDFIEQFCRACLTEWKLNGFTISNSSKYNLVTVAYDRLWVRLELSDSTIIMTTSHSSSCDRRSYDLHVADIESAIVEHLEYLVMGVESPLIAPKHSALQHIANCGYAIGLSSCGVG